MPATTNLQITVRLRQKMPGSEGPSSFGRFQNSSNRSGNCLNMTVLQRLRARWPSDSHPQGCSRYRYCRSCFSCRSSVASCGMVGLRSKDQCNCRGGKARQAHPKTKKEKSAVDQRHLPTGKLGRKASAIHERRGEEQTPPTDEQNNYDTRLNKLSVDRGALQFRAFTNGLREEVE